MRTIWCEASGHNESGIIVGTDLVGALVALQRIAILACVLGAAGMRANDVHSRAFLLKTQLGVHGLHVLELEVEEERDFLVGQGELTIPLWHRGRRHDQLRRTPVETCDAACTLRGREYWYTKRLQKPGRRARANNTVYPSRYIPYTFKPNQKRRRMPVPDRARSCSLNFWMLLAHPALHSYCVPHSFSSLLLLVLSYFFSRFRLTRSPSLIILPHIYPNNREHLISSSSIRSLPRSRCAE